MRDSLVQTTKALSGATAVNSSAIGLGHDGAQTQVGTPLNWDYEIEVSYPQNPTGTTPSVACNVQDTVDGTNWALCKIIHDIDATTTGYPKNASVRLVTRPKARAVRAAWALFAADNNYGIATVSLIVGGRRNS